MPQIQPLYGIHYKPGSFIFTRKDGSSISEGIVWFLDQFDAASFIASHVLIVYDERWGIEAAEEGVKWCRLYPLFNDPSYSVVVKNPKGLDEYLGQKIIDISLKYYGKPYDYLALVTGFPMQLLTKVWKVLPFLKKLPIPLHYPGAFVCSAFGTQVLKDTREYDECELIKEWHVSRVTPTMLYRDKCLWDEFRYELGEYEKTRLIDKLIPEVAI